MTFESKMEIGNGNGKTVLFGLDVRDFLVLAHTMCIKSALNKSEGWPFERNQEKIHVEIYDEERAASAVLPLFHRTDKSWASLFSIDGHLIVPY